MNYANELNDNLPSIKCVASNVIVGLPSICRQLLVKNAKFVVKLLASKSGSRVV